MDLSIYVGYHPFSSGNSCSEHYPVALSAWQELDFYKDELDLYVVDESMPTLYIGYRPSNVNEQHDRSTLVGSWG